MDPEQVVLVVDGQRVTGRVRGLYDLTRIPIENVERVEIIKGPGSALYGADAMGGVINIITRRRARPEEGTVTASFGERQELNLRGTAAARRGDFTVRLGAGRRTALPFDRDPSTASTNVPGRFGFDVDGSLTWAPSEDASVHLDTDYLWRDLTSIDQYETGAVVDRRERSEVFNTTLGGRTGLGGGLLSGSVRYSLFRYQLLQDQRASRGEGDQYEQSMERLWNGVGQFERPLGDRHVLTAGAEQAIFLERAARFGSETRYRYRTGLFVQDEWAVLGEESRLTLVPGVRVDIDSQFGSQPSPRVAVGYKPRDDLHLRLSYGWGFRPPSFQELYIAFENPAVGYRVNGNESLRPERSQGVTLSLDHAVSDGVHFALSVFRNELQDLIAVVTVAPATGPEPIVFGYQNIGRARTQGGEASARFRVWPGGWLDLGYQLLDARDLETGAVLEGRGAHRVTAQLAGRVRPWDLDLSLRVAWNSPRTFYPLGGDNVIGGTTSEVVQTESTTVVEAKVSRRFFSWGTAFLGVHNLLDAGDAVYLPIPPRQVYAGVQLELP